MHRGLLGEIKLGGTAQQQVVIPFCLKISYNGRANHSAVSGHKYFVCCFQNTICICPKVILFCVFPALIILTFAEQKRMMKTLAGTFLLFLISLSQLYAQSISFDFETWNPDSTLSGWAGSGFGAARTSTAHSGTYAISVWNWYYYGKGYYANSPQASLPLMQEFPLHKGQPIAFRPNAVSGYYRYVAGDNSGGADSAWIRISLTRYNTLTQQSDSVGKGLIKLPFSQNYQPFFMPVNYFGSATPDSFYLELVSSVNGFCNNNGNGECLYLSVDDISLSTTTGEQALKLLLTALLLSENTLQLQGYENTLLTLYNASGAVCLQKNIASPKAALDVSALPEGMYIASFSGSSKYPPVKCIKSSR